MYVLIVVAFMLVFPLASVGIQVAMEPHAGMTVLIVNHWFVFWAVGIRLLLAGIRQIFQPRYTAQVILGMQGEEAYFLVRELGFANVAIGCVATLTLWVAQWTPALSLVGGIFYGLAGINHIRASHRGALQDVAMVSDFIAAAVLLGTGLPVLLR